MPSVADVEVRQPSETESENCKQWPIWRCDPSTFDWAYTERETCLLLEGKVTVSDGQHSVHFASGDLVIFPKDLECTWEIQEAVVKHYTFS